MEVQLFAKSLFKGDVDNTLLALANYQRGLKLSPCGYLVDFRNQSNAHNYRELFFGLSVLDNDNYRKTSVLVTVINKSRGGLNGAGITDVFKVKTKADISGAYVRLLKHLGGDLKNTAISFMRYDKMFDKYDSESSTYYVFEQTLGICHYFMVNSLAMPNNHLNSLISSSFALVIDNSSYLSSLDYEEGQLTKTYYRLKNTYIHYVKAVDTLGSLKLNVVFEKSRPLMYEIDSLPSSIYALVYAFKGISEALVSGDIVKSFGIVQ